MPLYWLRRILKAASFTTVCFQLQKVSYSKAAATALVEDWPVSKFISPNNSTILDLNT